MAEDLVELGMEAVAPITDHHEKAWQKVKSTAKGGFSRRSPSGHGRYRDESDNLKSKYQDKDGSRYEYEQSHSRRSQYSRGDDNRHEDDHDSGYRNDSGRSNRQRNRQPSENPYSQRAEGARRPRPERRASSLDRGDFEESRSSRRRHSRKDDRDHSRDEGGGHGGFHGIHRKDALTAGLAGMAAIYLASGFYKDHKNKETQRGDERGSRRGRSRTRSRSRGKSGRGRNYSRSEPDSPSQRR